MLSQTEVLRINLSIQHQAGANHVCTNSLERARCQRGSHVHITRAVTKRLNVIYDVFIGRHPTCNPAKQAFLAVRSAVFAVSCSASGEAIKSFYLGPCHHSVQLRLRRKHPNCFIQEVHSFLLNIPGDRTRDFDTSGASAFQFVELISPVCDSGGDV